MEPYVFIQECSHETLCSKMNLLHVMGYRMQGSVVSSEFNDGGAPYIMLGVMMYLKPKEES